MVLYLFMEPITYTYNHIVGGYRWNILQRIIVTIGIEPLGIGDTMVGESMKTFVQFSTALSPANKSTLDTIMADNPQYPPSTSNTIGLITDIWNERAAFQTAIGLTYTIYYDESVRGSGNVNQIKLHFNKSLTNTEKNKVKSEYAKLITI